jgi:hypothetical protein
VREIFRYSKRDNLPLTAASQKIALQSAAAEENRFSFVGGFAFTGFAFWSRLGNWATVRSEQQPLVCEALVRLARVTPRSR